MDRTRFGRLGSLALLRVGLLGLVLMPALVLGQAQAPQGTQSNEPSAHAELRDATAKPVGNVQITETPHGLILVANFTTIPEGTHAFHIHDTGKCEAPSFESAGPHFNPEKKAHGFAAAAGDHAGDLPNIEIPRQSGLETTYFVPNVTLKDGEMRLLDGNGAALVVHAKADDYRTDPSGDAGGRIACGVIEPGAGPTGGKTASAK